LVALESSAPQLVAVYSRSENSATDFANVSASSLKLASPPAVYHDGDASRNLDALLARSDVKSVIVVLPIRLQPSIILKAFAAGKHVISEKPVAPDVASGLDLIATYLKDYKPKGIIWRVAENFEAEPGFRAAGKAIKSGKIGNQVFSFDARVINYVDKTSKWFATSSIRQFKRLAENTLKVQYPLENYPRCECSSLMDAAAAYASIIVPRWLPGKSSISISVEH
jgi:predicted dehydrogenase